MKALNLVIILRVKIYADTRWHNTRTILQSQLTLARSIVVVTLTFCPWFPKGKLAWDGISLGFWLDNIFRLHCKILPEVNV